MREQERQRERERERERGKKTVRQKMREGEEEESVIVSTYDQGVGMQEVLWVCGGVGACVYWKRERETACVTERFK